MNNEDRARLTPQTFQNRPVTVEAMFYDDTDSGEAIVRWADTRGFKITLVPSTKDRRECLHIPLPGGTAVANFGDWVVRGGVTGHPDYFYVTPRANFAAVYEHQEDVAIRVEAQRRALGSSLLAEGGLPDDF